MKPKRWLLALLAAQLLQAAGAAEEWKSEQFHCAVVLPSRATWVQEPPQGKNTKIWLRKLDDSARIFLTVALEYEKDQKLTDEFINLWEDRALRVAKMTKTSGQRKTLAGVPAYEVIGTLTARGHTQELVTIVAIAHGKVYTLTTMKHGGAPKDDPEIQAFLASFRFLK